MGRGTLNRRDFLRSSACVGAAGVFSPGLSASQPDPKDDFGVLAIGLGGRGRGIALEAGCFGRIVACCDVDLSSSEIFLQKLSELQSERPKVYRDYREALLHKKVDLVTIGTPDHWHTPILIAALEAGKDVYCEKPMTLTVREGEEICRAVKKTGGVVQVGTQQRSDFEQRFLKAVVIARSGLLGQKLTSTCRIGASPRGGPYPIENPPAGLDWDFWLGPAPEVAYSQKRCHGSFRWWFEYSGGRMTDWGAHHVDISQWALGVENTGPDKIEAEGNLPLGRELTYELLTGKIGSVGPLNRFNTATAYRVQADYANGNRLEVLDEAGYSIRIKGELGEIFVSRDMLVGRIISEIEASESGSKWLEMEVIRLYRDLPPSSHMGDFIHCVKERIDPISDVYTHHRSMTTCHLANIALITGRRLRWDPSSEDFVNDSEASALLGRHGRAGYSI